MLLAIPLLPDTDAEMYWRRDFPGHPDQASAVRSFVSALLPSRPDLDDIRFVADELVVNAIRHTRSGRETGTFRVEVRHDERGVTISVSDQGGPRTPRIRIADSYDESGRGLAAIATLAHRWTWSGNEHGRTVTAFFPSTTA